MALTAWQNSPTTDVDTPGPTLISICRGIGMLEEAIRLVLPGTRVICSAEWEAYANAVVLARMEETTMEDHPVWCGDIAGLRLAEFRGLVDILCAGLPCQPYSLAGTREGNVDHRSWGNGEGPLPHTLRLISECRPSVVFLENVSAWVRSANQWFRPFGDELCRLGYTLLEPFFVAAEDVGANHGRERVFILAYSDHHGLRASRWERSTSQTGENHASLAGGSMVDAEIGVLGSGLRQGGPQQHRTGSGSSSQQVAEPASQGLAKRRDAAGLRKLPTVERGCPQVFAPGPGDFSRWREILKNAPHLAPAIKPRFRVLVDGLAYVVDQSRADQLRCAGNGVVALQAAVAFEMLLREAGIP